MVLEEPVDVEESVEFGLPAVKQAFLCHDLLFHHFHGVEICLEVLNGHDVVHVQIQIRHDVDFLHALLQLLNRLIEVLFLLRSLLLDCGSLLRVPLLCLIHVVVQLAGPLGQLEYEPLAFALRLLPGFTLGLLEDVLVFILTGQEESAGPVEG